MQLQERQLWVEVIKSAVKDFVAKPKSIEASERKSAEDFLKTEGEQVFKMVGLDFNWFKKELASTPTKELLARLEI